MNTDTEMSTEISTSGLVQEPGKTTGFGASSGMIEHAKMSSQMSTHDLKYDVELRELLETQLYGNLEKIRDHRTRLRRGWKKLRNYLVSECGVDARLTPPRLIRFCRRHGGEREGWAVPVGVGKGRKKMSKVGDKPEVIRVARPAPDLAKDQAKVSTLPRPVLQVPEAAPAAPAPVQDTGFEPGAEPVLVQPVDVPVAPVGVPGVPPKPGEPGYLSPSERARLAREKQARELAEKLEEDKKYKFIPEGGLGHGDIPDDLFYR